MNFNSQRPCVFDDPKNIVGIPKRESTNIKILVNEIQHVDDRLEVKVYLAHNRSSGIHKSAKGFVFKWYDEETPYMTDESSIDMPPWMNEINIPADFYKNPLNQLVHPYITLTASTEYLGENIWYIDDARIWVKIGEAWIQVATEWLTKIALTRNKHVNKVVDEWEMYKNLGSG
jgi:hypothetical protein